MRKIILKKEVVSIYLILSLITSGLIGFLLFNGVLEDNIVKGTVIIVDCNGDGDHTTIQAAINAADQGDTIYVWTGIYNENIIINKTITLVGNGTINSIIQGTGGREVVRINSNWVNFTGFTIIDGEPDGIVLNSVEYVQIINNNCSKNGYGIYIKDSKNIIIENNSLYKNENGIIIDKSESSTLKNNSMISSGLSIIGEQLSYWNTHNIDNNNTVNSKKLYYSKNTNGGTVPPDAGQVILANSENITIQNQNLSMGNIGIELGFSYNNSIKNNTCSKNNKFGIHLYKSNLNIITNNSCNFNYWDAINVAKSSFNIITNNTCTNNNNGIDLVESDENKIKNNVCNLNNLDGIHSRKSIMNNFINNTCNSNNDDGIDLFESDLNTMINNNCTLNLDYGIVIQYSKKIKAINNTLVSCGLHIIGYLLSHYNTHTIGINNTVNAKPIYYEKNIINKKIPLGAGQVILVNCSKVSIEHQNLSDGSTSIGLFYSENNFISNNLCNQNNDYGIYLWKSNQNVITNNTCKSNYYHGILISESKYNTIFNNTCNLNIYQGIYLKYSNSNTIQKNFCSSNNMSGILPRNSKYNSIVNNTCNSNHFYGIYLDLSDSNDIIKNNCNSNIYDGIWIGESDLNTIIDNTCDLNDNCGIYLSVSDQNTITNNTCKSNYNEGVLLENSDLNTVTKNYCTDNFYGIKISHSRSNFIENNNFERNYIAGIILDRSEINAIMNNTCDSNTWIGIELQESDWNNIYNNSLINSDVSIYSYHSNSNKLTSNKCNSNDYYGIYLKGSKSNYIANNSCSFNNHYGIILNHSSVNAFENNSIINNWKGIFLYQGSNNNLFFDNIISNNSNLGVSISSGSKLNRFYYNRFINNAKQADEEATGYNYWDNGNGEGNYWSDYSGKDNGANGRVPKDGIGDTGLPHLGLDNYPFVQTFGWYFPGTPILTSDFVISPDGNFTFSWNETKRTIGYVLEEDNEETFTSPIILQKGWSKKNELLIYNKSNRAEGTYCFRLKAYNEQYESEWSNMVNITVDYSPKIPRKLNISVYPEGNALNLTWESNLVDTVEYEIYYKITNMGEWKYLNNIEHPQHIFNHSNLSNSEEYYYKIRAKDSIGQYSSFSRTVSAIPLDSVPPNKPNGLTVEEITVDSIALVWNANIDTDLEGYNIYRSTIPNPKDWGEPIHSTIKGDEKYIDLDLASAFTYYYVINAYDEVPNNSSFSNLAYGTTKIIPHWPEINNSIADFEMMEDSIDNTSINLYYWFKDLNKDTLEFRCEGQVNVEVIIYQENGSVVIVPDKDWNGQETLTFYANDSLLEIYDIVTITILPVNDPPGQVRIQKPSEGEEIKDGVVINFTGVCYDVDLPYGDKLTFNWSSNISGKFGVGKKLTNITLIPGYHSITLEVSDIVGKTSMGNVNITVFEISVEDKNETIPGKEENNMIFVIISISIILVIFIIIILFFIPGFIFPGWKKLSEKVTKNVEPSEDQIKPNIRDSKKPEPKSLNKQIIEKKKENVNNNLKEKLKESK
jgi:parallel beta-helix repeat protein